VTREDTNISEGLAASNFRVNPEVATSARICGISFTLPMRNYPTSMALSSKSSSQKEEEKQGGEGSVKLQDT
jgi:hypothetical protein